MLTSRPLVVAIAAMAIATPLLAAPASAGPSPHSEATSAATTPAEPSSISWGRCPTPVLHISRMQCTTVRSPLDPSQADGATVSLAVSRIRHTSSAAKYRGVILLNPGGPGGAGLSMPSVSGALPKKVRSRYDWIGFDPRGVGESRPKITCDPDYFDFDRPDYFPRPMRNLEAWLSRSKGYARDCAKNGPILDHMRTTDSVADMEVIRRALGADRINYLGFSYGTYLGQVYSTLHPQRVDRMILDSNIDPQRVFYKANLDQDIAMQKNLNRWFKWIATKDRTFQLGATKKAVTRLFNRTERNLAKKPAAGKIGASEWTDIFNGVTYSRSEWFSSASLFANYINYDNSKELVRAFRASYDYGDDNGFAVYSAVQCTDAPWPIAWSTWSRDNWRVYRKAPNTTWMNAWFNAQCRYWPAAPGPRFTVDGRQAPPMLLIGGTYDGATPFPGSLVVRDLFPESALVEIVGSTTHADSLSNKCSLGYITRFLGSGALPARKPGNRPDVRCPLSGKGRGLG